MIEICDLFIFYIKILTSPMPLRITSGISSIREITLEGFPVIGVCPSITISILELK